MHEANALARFGLAGRVAVVTGASRGIGAAIAAGFVEAGATTFGLSRTASAPSGVTPLYCDFEQIRAIPDVFAEIGRRTGHVDILVNGASISLPAGSGEFDREIERFHRTITVDLLAVYATVTTARPRMRRGGSIINITSINSILGFPGNPGYVAAKAGLAGLTRALAVDLAVDGIRVNALAPGYVRTGMTEASYTDAVKHEERRRHTLLGRWGTPNDIVGAAIFLASDASAYMTGQELFIDGGWTANGLLRSTEGMAQ